MNLLEIRLDSVISILLLIMLGFAAGLAVGLIAARKQVAESRVIPSACSMAGLLVSFGLADGALSKHQFMMGRVFVPLFFAFYIATLYCLSRLVHYISWQQPTSPEQADRISEGKK